MTPNITLSAAERHTAHLIRAMQRARSVAAENDLHPEQSPLLSPEGASDLLMLEGVLARAQNGTLEPSGFWNAVALVQRRYPALEVHLLDQDHHLLPILPGAMLLPWRSE